jgi:dethiobiotin synthetase
MSGNTKTANGEIIPGDAYFVKKISGIKQPLSEMCRYTYEMPTSPNFASRCKKTMGYACN